MSPNLIITQGINNIMFTDITSYPFIIVTYKNQTYLLIAKRNIKSLSFDMNFLIVGLVVDTGGEPTTLSYRLNKLMNETSDEIKETWFKKKFFGVSKLGVFVRFEASYKELVIDFFKKIPFFKKTF
jgi:hypothetical protein